MSRQIWSHSLLSTSVLLTLACLGCQPEYHSTLTSEPLYCAGLDEYREIELSYGVRKEREGMEPERTHEQLVLKIRPRPSLRSKVVLKSVERKAGVKSGALRFPDVVARTDETGQKVWFVQNGTGRILATMDLETGKATGPDDEPPAWATPEGGRPLKSACES
jgi:hypothetical protein